MASNRIDRITCSFYEDILVDEQLLYVLNRVSPSSRARCYKLKEFALEYIKEHFQEELKEFNKEKQNSELKEHVEVHTSEESKNTTKNADEKPQDDNTGLFKVKRPAR